MLARLDTDLAPLRASVDREGTMLRLDGPGEDDPAGRVVAIVEQMGYIVADPHLLIEPLKAALRDSFRFAARGRRLI